MPEFNEMSLKLEGFHCCKPLDLNVGYYNIQFYFKIQVTYVGIFSYMENTISRTYRCK